MRGGRRAFAAACGALVLGTLLVLGQAVSFSGGNAPAARTGCGPGAGCHGVPGQPSPLVMALLDGVPEAYTPGVNHTLTVTIEGGPPVSPVAENAGGFALEVSAGSLRAVDGAAQAAGVSATHTESGNDQRSWELEWLAPSPGAGEVQFFLSVNAVNGNALQDPGDQWTMATFTSSEGPAPPAPPATGNATGNQTGDAGQPPPRTPFPSGLEAALAAAGSALLLAARRRR